MNTLRIRRSSVVTGLAVLVLAGCGGTEEPPDLGPVIRPVRMATVGAEDVARLTFPGTVQASERAELSFRVSGDLVQLPVNEGDFLRAGQLVAQLDTRDFEIAVAEATAIYEQSKADRDRYQRLYETEAVPLADLELRRAQVDVSAARLEQARANLSYTTLTAPFDGWVGRRYHQNFERVLLRDPIISLHDVRRLEIVVDVPELVMTRIEDQDEIAIVGTFSADPAQEFPLTIKERAAEADPDTRTYRVVFTMPQPRGFRVLPGMTATVIARRQEGRATEVLTIPSQAVFADEAGVSHVWVVDPSSGTVTARRVEVGEVIGQAEIELLGGLEVGETIATTAVATLENGMRVRPLEGR